MSKKSPRQSPNEGTTRIVGNGLHIILNSRTRVLQAVILLPVPFLCLGLLLTLSQWMPHTWSLESYARSAVVALLYCGLLATLATNVFTVSSLWSLLGPWRLELLPEGVNVVFAQRQDFLPWSKLAGFRARQHQAATKEATNYVMLPIGIGLLSITTYEEKIVRWRDIQLLASDAAGEKVIATFKPSYHFDRWYRQKLIAGEIESRGGRVRWQSAAVVAVSLQGTSIDDAGIAGLLPSLEKLPELNELDLSQTRVTDASLHTLLVLKKLSTIVAAHAPITPEGLAGFAASLEKHRKKGDFAFLG